jgi:hypothetical protein
MIDQMQEFRTTHMNSKNGSADKVLRETAVA